jgi:hypothetical protein
VAHDRASACNPAAMNCPPETPPHSTGVIELVREWAVPIAELTIRIAAILLAAELLLSLPLPLEGTSLTLVQALVVLAAVALIGVALLETLFYDHYRP